MNGDGGFPFNSTTPTPTFDNLLLQSLMSRLQLRPSNLHVPLPFSAPQSLDDLTFSDMLRDLSEYDSDSENDDSSSSSKTQLAREESKLEKEIVRTILSGEIETLKANSGQAISIREHHICVGFQEESDSDYRVWEWHGHIMLFDEENGYTPEYIYGNYFERICEGNRNLKKNSKKEEESGGGGGDDDDKMGNLGLKELIENGDSGSGHILHRNLNAMSGNLRF